MNEVNIQVALTPLIEEHGEASVLEAVRRWYFPAVQRKRRKDAEAVQLLRQQKREARVKLIVT